MVADAEFCISPFLLLYAAPMKTMLGLPDYLDMEWFLDQDASPDGWVAAKRDRAWGVAASEAGVQDEWFPAFWLARRREEASGILPSSLYRRFRAGTAWCFCVLALFAGIGVVRALLAYSGTSPINVAVFLLVAVVPPCILCVVSLLALFWTGAPWRGQWSFLALVVRHGTRIPGLPRQASFVRAVLTGQQRYGRVVLLDGMRLSHLAGVAFSVGMLLCFLLSVVTTDLAFGWQSTLEMGPAGVRRVVAGLALPWSWVPGLREAVPTLAEIEGSRIVLKDGIAALGNADLAAWWPFLGMCLMVYALFPRLGLAFWTHRQFMRREAALTHPGLARIVDRMRAPLLRSTGRGEEKEADPLPVVADGSEPIAPAPRASDAVLPGQDACMVLFPRELEGRISLDELGTLARRVSGYPVARFVPLNLGEDDVPAVLFVEKKAYRERIVVLVEAWQPPIREVLVAMRSLALDGAPEWGVQAVLVGRPEAGNWLAPPSETEVRVWADAVERLAPARVELFPVGRE